MSLFKNIVLMGTSTAMRLGFGMLTFVAMARMLGPEPFGLFMLWLSVATLLSLLANFGLATYLLKEIGAAPETAEQVMSEVLTAKLILSTGVLLISAITDIWIDSSSRPLLTLLIFALLADSLTDFLNVGFRATNRFADEARIASIVSIFQFIIVIIPLWIHNDVLIASISFLCSRIVVLLLTWFTQRRYFSAIHPSPIKRGLVRIKIATAYAADFCLQSLFGQIDSVVLNYFTSPVSVGLYQAGMRIFNGGAQAAGVMANVFLPRAAAVAADPIKLNSESLRIQWAFMLFGLIFGLALAVFSKFIVQTLYGPAYYELTTIMPWIGFLFFVRFFAASWGVILTSAGAQHFRAAINLIHWPIVLLLATQLIPKYGTIAWIWCLIIGNIFISIAYSIKGLRISNTGFLQPAVACLAIILFTPFLDADISFYIPK